MNRETLEKANEIIEKIEFIKCTKNIYESELNKMINNRNDRFGYNKEEIKERILKILQDDLDDDIEILELRLNNL
jgi:hypothetical protein